MPHIQQLVGLNTITFLLCMSQPPQSPCVCVSTWNITYNDNLVRPRWTRASSESVYVFCQYDLDRLLEDLKKPSNSLALLVSLGKVRDSYRKESALLLQLTQRWRKSNLNVCEWPAEKPKWLLLPHAEDQVMFAFQRGRKWPRDKEGQEFWGGEEICNILQGL